MLDCGLCKYGMSTKESVSRVRMTYINSTAELKEYSQALQGVQMDQGNLSVPKERKMRVKFTCSITEDRRDILRWKNRPNMMSLCEVNI